MSGKIHPERRWRYLPLLCPEVAACDTYVPEGRQNVGFVAEPMTASPREDGQMSALFNDGFPAFLTADQQVKQHIGRVRLLFEDLELVLLDGGVIVAAAWGVPI